MAIAVRSLLKGLRYITSMFEEEKEPEMQIGGPTDVKHVAHIGWDGPTASAPTWMDQFKGEGDPNAPNGGESQAQPTKQPRRKKAKDSGKPKKSKQKAETGPDPNLGGG